MKQILIGTMLIVLVTGCHTSRDAGSPGDERSVETGGEQAGTYQPGENDRHTRSKVSNNLKTSLSR